MMNILISGINGFIGSELGLSIAMNNNVVGFDTQRESPLNDMIIYKSIELTDGNEIRALCDEYFFDFIIHCAGIAHHKIGSVDYATYMEVNSEATENLAKISSEINPQISFIFLSSISLYGEDNLVLPVSEEKNYNPSSDYAKSKLDAERRLISLSEEGILNNLIILRLAPVYDREWSFNLDRRVFAPKKIAYIKFGNGQQKMSALARPNLVEFIQYLLQRPIKNRSLEIMNVSDSNPYEFNEIIQVFRKSKLHPNRPIFRIPLFIIWITTRIAGFIFKGNRKWIHSCYDKLSSSMIFDNTRMLKIGFKPRHSLQTIFNPQRSRGLTQIKHGR